MKFARYKKCQKRRFYLLTLIFYAVLVAKKLLLRTNFIYPAKQIKNVCFIYSNAQNWKFTLTFESKQKLNGSA